MSRAITKVPVLMFFLLGGMLVAGGLWAFITLKTEQALPVYPKYALLLVAPSDMHEDGEGYSTEIIELDGKMHTRSGKDTTGGVLSYTFAKQDLRTKQIKEYQVPVPQNRGRIAVGTFPIPELQSMTVSTNNTSPDGFTYTSCKMPDDEVWEVPCLIKDNKPIYIDQHTRPLTRFIGWIVEETPPPSPPKHKIAIGYMTAFFQDGGLGNLVSFETVNGKLHINYTQVKEPPFAGYDSYAISIYDFATQSEKIINLPLISKSAKGWHVYEGGTHLISELSQYTLDPNPTSPDGYTYNDEASLAIKNGYAFPLVRKEYLYRAENIPEWYKEDTTIYPESPLQGYTAGKYKEGLRLEGEFLGWIIDEE